MESDTKLKLTNCHLLFEAFCSIETICQSQFPMTKMSFKLSWQTLTKNILFDFMLDITYLSDNKENSV